MEKEFEELTKKLEDMYLLVRSDDYSEENCNAINNYSHELQMHNERLSQMLTNIPQMEYSVPQVLELCNTDNTVETVPIGQESALNQNVLIQYLCHIDISDLMINMKQFLMERIDDILSSISNEHPDFDFDNAINNENNVIRNINYFNDVNSKMKIIRELYSLGVYQTTLQGNLIDCCLRNINTVVTLGTKNDMSILFIIPLLHNFRPDLNACQALVIVPTGDLAVYVKQAIENVKKFLGFEVQLAKRDNNNLFDVPQFEVGLPGELQYKMIQGSIRRDFIKTVVVISPNEMLPNVELICQGIIRSLQRDSHITLILSDIIDTGLINRYNTNLGINMEVSLPNPYDLQSIFLNLPPQFFSSTNDNYKKYLFAEMDCCYGYRRSIVFCNSLDRAQELCSFLCGFSPTLFHLEMNVNQRNQILESFTLNKVRLLITLDSIKVNELFQLAKFVVYYDFPANPIAYLNTITQFDKNVKVINLINKQELNVKKVVETICKSSMIPWPTKSYRASILGRF